MPTLGELMEKFASAAPADDNTLDAQIVPQNSNPADDGAIKIASGGEPMKSLSDIYLALNHGDLQKEAAFAASIPTTEEISSEEEIDFAKMAEQLAGAEATDVVGEQDGVVKIAQEYDSAGRIMARGFYDEFMKLSGAMDTDVSSNQMTESPSAASTPALGDRGLPTVETNFAGNDAHDQKIETAGPESKKVYADTLKPKKTISAGQGTGDDPEAAAISLGGGSPAGFATVRDLSA